MSKYLAYRLDGPFSSTSHHQALARPASAMWLGTMSSTWPQAPGGQRARPAAVAGLAAELGVQLRVVDHVVAVRAARRRLQVRRAVQVADAEVGEVAGDRGGVVEGEPGVQLDPVGRRPHQISPSRGPAAPRAFRPGTWRQRRSADATGHDVCLPGYARKMHGRPTAAVWQLVHQNPGHTWPR